MTISNCKYCGQTMLGDPHRCAEFWRHPDNRPPEPRSHTVTVPGRMSFSVLETKNAK